MGEANKRGRKPDKRVGEVRPYKERLDSFFADGLSKLVLHADHVAKGAPADKDAAAFARGLRQAQEIYNTKLKGGKTMGEALPPKLRRGVGAKLGAGSTVWLTSRQLVAAIRLYGEQVARGKWVVKEIFADGMATLQPESDKNLTFPGYPTQMTTNEGRAKQAHDDVVAEMKKSGAAPRGP